MVRKLKQLICALWVLLPLLLCAAPLVEVNARLAPPPQKRAATKVDFKKEIEPILSAGCYACHAGARSLAGLRLDTREAALKGGVSGPSIVPGKGGDSLLVRRLVGHADGPRMPFKQPPLAPAQIALIRRWIDQGAEWPDAAATTNGKVHWAYVKPVAPRPPAVQNTAWPRNPLDQFVLARLEKEGLKPSPEAAKETLIRRLSLDLTGLPPSPREVDEFVADRRPDAYEKLVDRLMASPHFGERWARPWLDLARYADTNGFEKDRPRTAWKYRDWVIDAFNRDLPFDRFTIEQIAGDMLPDATPEQRIATGFHRNAMLNEEGGVDPEEARWETLVDRVGTTATVWLGTTLACAQCHNHKYDPFTQKEFYQFLAFFNNTEYQLVGPAAVSEQKLAEPQLEMPTPEQSAKRAALQAELKRLKDAYETDTPALEAAQKEWEQRVLGASGHWTMLTPVNLASTGGSLLSPETDGSVFVSGANPLSNTYTFEAKVDLRGMTGIRLEVLGDKRLPRGGPGRDLYGNFFLNGFAAEVVPAGASGQAEPVRLKGVVVDDPTRELKPIDFLGAARRGWSIDATREEERLTRQAVFVSDKPFGFDGETLIRIRLAHNSEFIPQGIGRFRLSVTTAPEPATVARVPSRLRSVLQLAAAQRTAEQARQLRTYFRSATPLLKEARERLGTMQKELDGLGITSALVMQERSSHERPSTFLRVRGSYTNVGDRVYAATPAALHPLPESQLANRLGLAYWLVDENNPLTARVTVSRFWEQLFGRGLVETGEDFGAQGTPPVYPEMLDWLATEFKARKWSMKSIIRTIVTSATYRQSSRVTPLLLERDPYNRLLARGPRFRLEGEVIRDLGLAVSGLLSPKVGGPSVFPYQPEGIWDNAYDNSKWEVSPGADRHRRALYTFWRRTSPYPSMVTFDATSREFCTVQRVRTNTPLQALTTLNDPAFFDMARGLAARIIAEAPGRGADSRAAYGFRLCTSRAPNARETEQLVALYEQQLARFRGDGEAARKLLGGATAPGASDGDRAELAAWTVVANVLLNLDETITRE